MRRSRLVEMSHNPILAFYPVASGDPSIPLPSVFSLLSLFVHLNFVLIFWSDKVRIYFRLASPPTSLSFPMLYCLSAVAPTFSFFLNKPWQTILWWSITTFMVFIVQTILDSIQKSDDIICLESLKYVAPGAWMVSRTSIFYAGRRWRERTSKFMAFHTALEVWSFLIELSWTSLLWSFQR